MFFVYKMCSLSWPEKYGIRVLFGKTPEITFDDAYNDFLKVIIKLITLILKCIFLFHSFS